MAYDPTVLRESRVHRRHSRKRFWSLLAPAVLVAGAVLGAEASGAVAASVAASGEAFKASGDRLSGSGFTALPGVNTDPRSGTRRPVVVVTAQRAEVTNLCVSVLVKSPLGPVTVRVAAGQDEPVKATGLVVDSDQLHADINFTDVLAQASDTAGFLARTGQLTVKNPRFTGWRGTAGSFHLDGLGLRLVPGRHECF
ncbi:DUF6230 family protein [Streptomyces sp. NPDC001407]|uniref:DUF6230 family protein n=1 Tax=Streptomyces sp. NPDC001407 TaxID=3364573 RepID=UPI003678DEA7